MRKENTITIYGLSNEGIAYCEAKGLSKCFGAYAEHCSRDYIMESGIGFNPNSGYVYIALESGIQICCCLGREIEYLVTDFETGDEMFYETYDEAIKKISGE